MAVEMVGEVQVFEQEELGLLSQFFQNARTLCQVLAREMQEKRVTEYVLLLESLRNSLDHGWPLVASLEKKGEAELKDIGACVERVNTFLGVVRTHKALTQMDKKELINAVGGLQTDLSSFAQEKERVYQLVRGIKDQLKKVVGLLVENLKGFTSTSLDTLKEMVVGFEADFGKLVEKQGKVKARLVDKLKDFLNEKGAEAVRLLGAQNIFPGQEFRLQSG